MRTLARFRSSSRGSGCSGSQSGAAERQSTRSSRRRCRKWRGRSQSPANAAGRRGRGRDAVQHVTADQIFRVFLHAFPAWRSAGTQTVAVLYPVLVAFRSAPAVSFLSCLLNLT